jgi:hypothetical protein
MADEAALPAEGQQQEESAHAAANLEPPQKPKRVFRFKPKAASSTPAAAAAAAAPPNSALQEAPQQPAAGQLGSAAAQGPPAKMLRGTNGPVRNPLADVGNVLLNTQQQQQQQQQMPVLGKRQGRPQLMSFLSFLPTRVVSASIHFLQCVLHSILLMLLSTSVAHF